MPLDIKHPSTLVEDVDFRDSSFRWKVEKQQALFPSPSALVFIMDGDELRRTDRLELLARSLVSHFPETA